MPQRPPLVRFIHRAFDGLFFSDAARPVELLSLMALTGWVWSLLSLDGLFLRQGFSAFRDGLPPRLWAALMAAVIVAQLAGLWPRLWGGPIVRFLAMAAAAGVWTVVAIGFWQGDGTTGKGTYSAIAAVTALAGVYLGWTSSRAR